MDENMLSFIMYHLTSIILDLYADPGLPRNHVQHVIQMFENLQKNVIIPCMHTDIKNILKSGKDPSQILKDIEKCISSYSNVFDKINTEDKRLALIKTKNFQKPKEFFIGSVFERKQMNTNRDHFISVPKYGCYCPLKKSLQMFLQIRGMLSAIMNYISDLSESSVFIKNCMQASLWSKKFPEWRSQVTFSNKNITLPLMVYFDEFVAGAALGANVSSSKFGAVYATILCLPPSIASKLSSFLFSTIVKAEDLSKLGNKKVFSQLVKDLNTLSSEGVEVEVGGQAKTIFFECFMIIGDNLGLNSIFDMKKSFNADFCCRICKATKIEIQEMVEEDEALLRNEDDYEANVRDEDLDKSGFHDESIFNLINGYHICTNFTVDVMHDIMEGVADYVMSNLITFYVNKKYFELHELNAQIKNFDFGNVNRPTEIKFDTETRGIKIKMSAAQMSNFVQFFGCLIGHRIKKSSEEDIDAWNLYKSLNNILMLATLPKLTSGTPSQLKDFIKELCILYKKLFGLLKPKFHFLIHYPEILRKMGPLVNFWCMRCESRHRILKAAFNAFSGNKSPLKTIAIKEMLRLCNDLHSAEVSEKVVFGPKDDSSCDSEILSSMTSEVLSKAEFFTTVQIDENNFRLGSVIVVQLDTITKLFGKIIKIISLKDEIYFVCKIYEEIVFDNDTLGYSVKLISTQTIKFTDLPDVCSCTMHEIYGKTIIMPETII